MAQILFTNSDTNKDHELYWCINSDKGGIVESRLSNRQTSEPLPSNPRWIGWRARDGYMTTYWDPYSKSYAYVVYSYPYSSAYTFPHDPDEEMLGATAEGAAPSVVEWRNNSNNRDVKWQVYTNGGEVSGNLDYSGKYSYPVPATRPFYFGWKVKSFSGRLLLNLTKPLPNGVAFQLTLENV
jgi:hypothetical protein